MSQMLSPPLALQHAFTHLEQAGARVIGAARTGSDIELAGALAEHTQAKIEVKAALATVRFADEMWRALLGLDGEAP